MRKDLVSKMTYSMIRFCKPSAFFVQQVRWHPYTISSTNDFLADYNAFKEVLTDYLDQDVPDIEELVKIKWEKYGQKFLRLCINHKTGIRFFAPLITLF
jgi:hypothetical protein